MPTVALVRLRYASQEYWFDPNNSGAQEGDHVIVETVHGKDVGLCIDGDYVVKSEDIQRPLKPVVRIATEEDLALCDELGEKEKEGMRVFRELVEKHGLDMRPTAVEFMFDQEHATFYFTADERVDFRSLVRDLASQFHVRVDMRQIGGTVARSCAAPAWAGSSSRSASAWQKSRTSRSTRPRSRACAGA